jgi:hypothetical protein
MLACSEHEQSALEVVLGEPLPEERAEVVFVDGVPTISPRQAGSDPVRPWDQAPIVLPLTPAGGAGIDRLRLRFSINDRAELVMEGEDLLAQTPLPEQVLGLVR